MEFSASITVPTAPGAPRFAQRTAVTIPDTVAAVTIAIKAARMTGVIDAVRSLKPKARLLGVVLIDFGQKSFRATDERCEGRCTQRPGNGFLADR